MHLQKQLVLPHAVHYNIHEFNCQANRYLNDPIANVEPMSYGRFVGCEIGIMYYKMQHRSNYDTENRAAVLISLDQASLDVEGCPAMSISVFQKDS